MEYMSFVGPFFVMQVPTSWYITASRQFQTAIMAPPSKEKVPASLTLSLLPAKPEVSVKDVIKEIKNHQKTEALNYELISEGETKISDLPAEEHLFKWEDKNSHTKILQRQILFLYKDFLCNITTTRVAGDFPEYDAIFGKMITTFKVAEETNP